MNPHRLQTLINFAAAAHKGQVDKAGKPYIWHPMRVASRVSDEAIAVALFHDVLEDTEYTVSTLEYWGLTQIEIQAVQLLTRPHKEPRPTYKDYIKFIAANVDTPAGRLALEVKLADLMDNMSPERHVPELAGLEKRYKWALDHLRPLFS